MKKLIGLFLAGFLGMSVNAHAGILQITATSASAGELGWFAVDEGVLAVDTSLQATQFFDFSFSDPLSSLAFDQSNVLADTGWTYFGLVGGTWTVTGGGANSLTSSEGGVWIAGSNYVLFRQGDTYDGNRYSDVTWSTTAYDVPEPSSLFLLGAGLAGLGFTRKLKKV